MNKITRIFILMTFIILTISNVLAQEKKVSQEDVTKLELEAWEMLKNTSYRIKKTSEHYQNVNDSKPYLYTNSITEITPAGTHDIHERKTVEGITRTEKIEIGKRIFTRKNDEGWKELTPKDGEMDSLPAPKSIDTERTVEVKYLGKDNINKQKADLYEVKATQKYKIRNNEIVSVYISKFWFEKKGRFLKTENILSDGNGKIIYSTITEYEYDPNIKIEIPIINEKEKP